MSEDPIPGSKSEDLPFSVGPQEGASVVQLCFMLRQEEVGWKSRLPERRRLQATLSAISDGSIIVSLCEMNIDGTQLPLPLSGVSFELLETLIAALHHVAQ